MCVCSQRVLNARTRRLQCQPCRRLASDWSCSAREVGVLAPALATDLLSFCSSLLLSFRAKVRVCVSCRLAACSAHRGVFIEAARFIGAPGPPLLVAKRRRDQGRPRLARSRAVCRSGEALCCSRLTSRARTCSAELEKKKVQKGRALFLFSAVGPLRATSFAAALEIVVHRCSFLLPF